MTDSPQRLADALTTPVAGIERDLFAHYASIRQRLPDHERIAVLLMDPAQMAIALGESAVPEKTWVLDLRINGLADRYFNNGVPTPFELENAIVMVEDEIAMARDLNGSASRLYTMSREVRAIARHAGLAEQETIVMSLGAVENTFGRLAAVAEGQPLASAGIPTEEALMAALLILRELMHHLRFGEIACVEPAGGGAG